MATISSKEFLGGGNARVIGNETSIQQNESQNGASFFQNLKEDLNNRADKVGEILNRPNTVAGTLGYSPDSFKGQATNVLEKGTQIFGQGAGAASNLIEKGVEQIPGVKQAFGAIGSGINWLATSEFSPIKKLGDVIGENKALQEATQLYDTDQNFKDSVDAVANIARLGGNVQMAADAVNLTKNLTSKIKTNLEPTIAGVKTTLENAPKITEGIKQATREIVPTSERIVNEEVTKALQLNASDVKNIESSTGNIVGEFMGKNNLIGNNLIETQKLVKDFFQKNYDTVRAEISKVQTPYKQVEIPRYKQALTELKNQIEGIAGQESKLKEVNDLLKKKVVSLNDVQRVKELVDDTYSLYKITGDVKEGVAKQGFAQIRSELKTFIEKQVKDYTGVDISDLNNKVSTSRSILDASETRSTSGLTKSNFKMGDLAIFGAGSMMGSPLFGAALLIGKKIIESPAIRFRIAKWLDGISDAKKLKIQEELSQGIAPKELQDLVQSSPKIENTKANIRAKTSISKTIPKNSLKGKETIPENSLISEAKKYKSVDKFVKNMSIKQYREFLNSQDIGTTLGERINSATGRKLGSTKRKYGDYLYAQDRDMMNNQLLNLKLDVEKGIIDSRLIDIWKKANKK